MKVYKPEIMSVYYAHPMSWYGSDLEMEDLAFLQTKFKSVINPGTAEMQAMLEELLNNPEYGGSAMDFFADLIAKQADIVAYRTFKDGQLGSGVGREVFEAKIHGLHIDRIVGGYKRFFYEPMDRHLIPGESMTIMHKLLTVDETTRRVREGEM